MQYCKNKVCYFFDPPSVSALDKQRLKQVPCLYCAEMIYCSEKCRDQDWNKQHQGKCVENPENFVEDSESLPSSSNLQSSAHSCVESVRPSLNQQFELPQKLHHLVDIQDRFLEDFQLLGKEIGSGTYGKVVLVQDVYDRRVYAMKIISKACLQDLSQQQLNREISIQKRLEHRNILKLYFFFQDREYVHLILEHASNGPITSLFKQNLSEQDIWGYFVQICTGINYLHASNVIHRDLKPENILLTADGTIKLCDFGWSAEVETPSQKRDTICGTIDYMAPEIVSSLAGYGPEVDLWSLGMVLFEFLNGSLPDRDEHPFKMVKVGVSPEAADFVNQLLRIDPMQRMNVASMFTHPWFTKMASAEQLQLLRSEVDKIRNASQSPLQQTYFQLDSELPDPNQQQCSLIIERSVRNTNISMSCLDEYLKLSGLEQSEEMQLLMQLQQNLTHAQTQIEKEEEIQKDEEIDAPLPKGFDALRQPRLSRISIRNNNIMKRDPPQTQLQRKSLAQKLADMFGCVNRDTQK